MGGSLRIGGVDLLWAESARFRARWTWRPSVVTGP